MQRRHSIQHLLWRGGVAAVSHAMTLSGVYPLVPHAWRRLRRVGGDDGGVRPLRAALTEWGFSAALSTLRPAGFFPLPGARGQGPRPVILVHGYGMNRANFVPLAYRLAGAGLGPVVGFEYWTLGPAAAAAGQLGWFVDQVREATGAPVVDLVGHSMGGVVARYYVTLGGGDAAVANLVTLGSPHAGTDLAGLGFGHARSELLLGSRLVQRLGAAPAPAHTRLTVIASRADALVPGHRQPVIPGAEVVMFDDLGHQALLGSRRVAATVIDRLRHTAP